MNGLQMKLATLFVLGGSLMANGCKGTAPAPAQNPATPAPAAAAPAPAQPGPMAIRNSDGSITNPDGSVTYAPGSKVAEKENNPNGTQALPSAGPARTPVIAQDPGPKPQGTPPAAPQVVRTTLASGTPVVVRINGGLAASRNNVGDRFTGSLEHALVSRGTTVFAAGTAVSGDVVAAKGKGRFKGAGDLAIQLTAIGRDRVATTEYEKSSKGRGKRTAVFAGGGAGLGAIIGGLAGGGKGALIGGLAGGGAGTAAGAYTGSRDVVIPAESVITFRLTEALTR